MPPVVSVLPRHVLLYYILQGFLSHEEECRCSSLTISLLRSKQRINERRHCGALGQHNKSAKQQQNNYNRRKPELLPHAQKVQQFFKKDNHGSSLELTFHRFLKIISIRRAFDPVR
jgi:hypothetical protein